MTEVIRSRLLALRDPKNAAFQAKLTPTLPADRFLGTRVPQVRLLAKELKGTADAAAFLADLPHTHYDENILHAILLSSIEDYAGCLEQVTAFLPYIDNWAVCDTLRPRVFRTHAADLLPQVKTWIASPAVYTCRFGIGMLMANYLDNEFSPAYLQLPAAVTGTDYYVRMMVAWYYATALAKQWTATVPILERRLLPVWTHNKTIQKSCESFRIPEDRKHYLRTLKIT